MALEHPRHDRRNTVSNRAAAGPIEITSGSKLLSGVFPSQEWAGQHTPPNPRVTIKTSYLEKLRPSQQEVYRLPSV